jgi:hypothetical protein
MNNVIRKMFLSLALVTASLNGKAGETAAARSDFDADLTRNVNSESESSGFKCDFLLGADPLVIPNSLSRGTRLNAKERTTSYTVTVTDFSDAKGDDAQYYLINKNHMSSDLNDVAHTREILRQGAFPTGPEPTWESHYEWERDIARSGATPERDFGLSLNELRGVDRVRNVYLDWPFETGEHTTVTMTQLFRQGKLVSILRRGGPCDRDKTDLTKQDGTAHNLSGSSRRAESVLNKRRIGQ